MAKRSSFGKSIRKRLSDITNCQPQQKSSLVFEQLLKLDLISSSDKEQIDHLLKENAGLMKVILDKQKIIEMNGVELQKLRTTVQKMQLQNWNLAQSNSHMMAELNLGKKKLKELQHQLGCKDAVLKTLNSDLQAMREMNDQKCEAEMKDREDDLVNRQNANRRIRPVRSQSTGYITKVKLSEEEVVENKRRRVRRQSARFTSQNDEPDENLFEIKDLKMHENHGPATIIEEKHDRDSLKPEPHESQRMSFGRPSRRAAEKVHSYKEVPLNIKMRRPE